MHSGIPLLSFYWKGSSMSGIASECPGMSWSPNPIPIPTTIRTCMYYTHSCVIILLVVSCWFQYGTKHFNSRLVSSITIFSVLQYVSRSSTAPGGFGGIGGLSGISQLGAPSPPPTRYYAWWTVCTSTYVQYHVFFKHLVIRGGMLPLGSGRTSLMSTGQGLSAPKPPSRPSSLSSAIGRWVFWFPFRDYYCS